MPAERAFDTLHARYIALFSRLLLRRLKKYSMSGINYNESYYTFYEKVVANNREKSCPFYDLCLIYVEPIE